MEQSEKAELKNLLKSIASSLSGIGKSLERMVEMKEERHISPKKRTPKKA